MALLRPARVIERPAVHHRAAFDQVDRKPVSQKHVERTFLFDQWREFVTVPFIASDDDPLAIIIEVTANQPAAVGNIGGTELVFDDAAYRSRFRATHRLRGSSSIKAVARARHRFQMCHEKRQRLSGNTDIHIKAIPLEDAVMGFKSEFAEDRFVQAEIVIG